MSARHCPICGSRSIELLETRSENRVESIGMRHYSCLNSSCLCHWHTQEMTVVINPASRWFDHHGPRRSSAPTTEQVREFLARVRCKDQAAKDRLWRRAIPLPVAHEA